MTFGMSSMYIFLRSLTFARDNAGETVPPNLSAPNGGGSDEEDSFAKKPKAGFSAFTSADLVDEIAAEDDDGGGLMVRFICMAYSLNQFY
jgi:hypothetical protein